MRIIRKKRRVRRDEYPNLSRLAWQAKRRSGAESLEVLQDALMTHFFKEFRAARRQAVARLEKRHQHQYVIFVPSLERERRKPERAKRIRHITPEIAEWYKENLPGEPTNPKEYNAWMSGKRWPFVITTKPFGLGESSVIVWGTDVKFKTHALNLKRKEGLSKFAINRLRRINENQTYGTTETYEEDDLLRKKGFISKSKNIGGRRGLLFMTRKGRKYLNSLLFDEQVP